MTRTGVAGLIVAAVATICLGSLSVLISGRECGNIDVRNNLASLNQLSGCTVVKGHLKIVLLTKNISVSDYSNITFPELREITDFFLLYDVKGLTSFKKLFPNLAVIRGRRLFLNYAFAVTNMPDLAAFELKSLVAIQHGHVFIGSCPKLCYLKKVNWDRLTLSPGENHVVPIAADATCPATECTGCESEYCWSNIVCQKFENDNTANLALGARHCHAECLGGCYNNTNKGCVVCKGISNHGVCVSECPSDMYYSEHHQRCYTKSECGAVRNYVYANKCNRWCPAGYSRSRKESGCIKCASELECTTNCSPPDGYSAFFIYNLGDADSLRGCHYLNGSLYIEFRNKIDEKDLLTAFDSVREVQGHIKVVGSPHLKSLGFLRNLEKVYGNPLENKTFAFVVYKNENLLEFWSPPAGKTVEFIHGGIYTYSNYKLCNRVTLEFSQSVIHDKDKDLLQLNDQEVLCDPARLNLEVKPVTQNTAIISWARNQTAKEVEVIYREAKYSTGEKSELDDHVCIRINWKRDLISSGDLLHNSSHFSYNITRLMPYTLYEVLVKTFQQKDGYSSRSPIQRFTTTADYPTAPKLHTVMKTNETITFSWTARNETKEVVDYYMLETFEQPIDVQTLDSRNFCKFPSLVFGISPFEDYDDCCRRMQQENEDEQFKRDMHDTFPCTVQTIENCHNLITYGHRANTTKFDVRLQNSTVYNLKPSTLYTFLVYACNYIGCGTYYMYSDKTDVSVVADDVGRVEACRIAEKNEYHLKFKEPENPNGAIVSYTIHFQKKQTEDLYRTQLECITRKQHELAGFEYVITLNDTFDEVAIRTASLMGNVLSKWFNVDTCMKSEPEPEIGAIGILMICSIVCVVVALIWMSIHKQWWKRVHCKTWRSRAQRIASADRVDDRQLLVATFDTVSFQNTPDD